MINVVDLFIDLVKHNTRSDQNSLSSPSTPEQMAFAGMLVELCGAVGLENITHSDESYVYAELPANSDVKTVVGLIAHMDTSPACSGEDVTPQIVRNYGGGEIILGKEAILSPSEFPELKKYVGGDIITTNGKTLLGADDKAGVAEILAAMSFLIENPEIPHGKIKIAFTPDEEIGRGADHFDVTAFGADFAYTVDGGGLGELQYESFNAARAYITITGKSVHPGTAKGVMVNSLLVANELLSKLPEMETPAHTEGYEGFYHVDELTGNVEKTVIDMIIRDFTEDGINARKDFMLDIVTQMNKKYDDRIIINLTDQYYNMRSVLENKIEVVNIAKEAMESLGITPIIEPIRGGTDGSRLSFMNLPCPNIFTGGHNFHGPFEFIPAESMKRACEVIVKIAEMVK